MGAPKYRKHILINRKGEINSNTITVGGFNTLISSVDHPDRKSIRKHRP